MDIRKVKKLIELLKESGIAEIEISEGEESVRISRYSRDAPISASPPAAAAEPAAVEAAATPDPVRSGPEVTSPMVGTFYSGPAPAAKPFLQIGSEVAVGAIVCVVYHARCEAHEAVLHHVAAPDTVRNGNLVELLEQRCR